MTTRTQKCTPAIRRGRLDKAKQFADTARLIEDDDAFIDAYVTNCVHAGIAAADVICCARLGEHATGPNHQDAIALITKVERSLGKELSSLLGMKTAAGYSDLPASRSKRKQASRAMSRLLEVAESEV